METKVYIGNGYFSGCERIEHGKGGWTKGFYIWCFWFGGFSFYVKCTGSSSGGTAGRSVLVYPLSS